MSTVIQPLGVTCNIQCRYCYENPQREAGKSSRTYDLEKIKATIKEVGGPFGLFGGEPLLIPVDDLESLFLWGQENYGKNQIQTNGTLISQDHILMFKRHNVFVGISIDGPGALNDARWVGNLESTRKATQKTLDAIKLLCQEGINTSIIITINRSNASAGRIPLLQKWLVDLQELGIKSVRLILLEPGNESIRQKFSLDHDEAIAAFLSLLELENKLTTLTIDIFNDIRLMLLGQFKSVACVWDACDPYTTAAVQGVGGNGQLLNCLQVNTDGVTFLKPTATGFERYIALYHTPQDYGGCSGCRFFIMCKGHCPGGAIDGDWRNRSEHCKVWKTLFQRLEHEVLESGRIPVSMHPRRVELEWILLNSWAMGINEMKLEDMMDALDGANRLSRPDQQCLRTPSEICMELTNGILHG